MATPTTFGLLAHELRAPAGVIGGYARMLRDGRLDDAQRDRVLGQIEAAAARVSVLADQLSALRRWLEPRDADAVAVPVSFADLVARAAARAPEWQPSMDARDADARIAVFDLEGMTGALAAVFDYVRRHHGTAPVVLQISRDGDRTAVMAGPASDLAAGHAGGRMPLTARSGGQGLALAVALAVFSAHDAEAWVAASGSVVGVTFLRPQVQP